MAISDHEIVKMSHWQQIFVSDRLEDTLKFYCELLEACILLSSFRFVALQ